MAQIGRLIDIGVGKESVRGTAVAASIWYPRMSGDLNGRVEMLDNESAMGVLEDVNQADVVAQFAEFSLEAKVRDLGYGYFLLNLFGQVSTVAVSGDASVKDHTFTILQNNQHPSLTLVENNAVQDLAYANAMQDSHELKIEANGYMSFTADGEAKYPTNATATPAHTDENEFVGRMVSVKFASTVAGLTGATATGKVRTASISFNKNIERVHALGSVDPEDIYNKQFGVKGELEIAWENNTFIDYMKNGTLQSMQLKATNTGKTIGTLSNPTLTFEFASVSFREISRNLDNDGIVVQTIAFNAVRSLGDGFMVRAILRNLQTAY